MSSIKQKSTIPVRHGYPNPCYGQALDLIRNASQYRELAMRIRAEAKSLSNAGNFDVGVLMQRCADNGVKEHLRTLFERHRAVPSAEPVLGAPPPTNELYGRFGHGVSVADVGSGNCMKLQRYTGKLKITAIDPAVSNEAKTVIKQFKGTLESFCGSSLYNLDIIFTSFMSLPQITLEGRRVLDFHDGLHMIPDHALLLHNRVAVLRESGRIEVRTCAKNYEDHPVDMIGAALEPGYLLCPTYATRTVEVSLSLDSVVQSYSPVIDARPSGFYDLNFADLGYKFDGEAYEVEANQGVVYMVNRAGKQFVGATSFEHQFCVHVEKLAECYVLIRVVAWRGFIPPHTGDCLRFFVERVKIYINGAPVLASPRWDGSGFQTGPTLFWDSGGVTREFVAPVDGIISRRAGIDHYCKQMWTIDIQENHLADITRALTKLGFAVTARGIWSPGLNECAMSREGAEVVIKPLKPRVDKLVPTSVDTVTFLVDKPTLAEHQVMTGSPATV